MAEGTQEPEAKDWLLAQRRGSVTVSDVADREASDTPSVCDHAKLKLQ